MQNIDAHIQPAAFIDARHLSVLSATNDLLKNHRDLHWLSWLINGFAGGAFSMSAGVTGRFVLLPHFWLGAICGSITYLIILLLLGDSESW